MASTLENDVRKAREDGDAFYDLIQATHRGVSSLGQKLAEFQRETADNFTGLRTEVSGLRTEMRDGFTGLRTETHDGFTGLRTEMHDEISEVRDTMGDVKAGVIDLKSDMRRQEVRMTKFNGRLDRLEGKSDKQTKQLDLIIEHLGIEK